jgi:hypothetical protein
MKSKPSAATSETPTAPRPHIGPKDDVGREQFASAGKHVSKLTVKTRTQEEFLSRGRQWAKAADQGRPILAKVTVSFEDPSDVSRFN